MNISVVIPVYSSEFVLEELVDELAQLKEKFDADNGDYRIIEVILVDDCGSVEMPKIINKITYKYDYVRSVWLSRNFGQHAATLAGISSASGDWIVTLDEDGEHNPSYIPQMLNEALINGFHVVYAKPKNHAGHGVIRNFASKTAKKIAAKIYGDERILSFNSYRLIDGEIGRNVAAYGGNGLYVDVGLLWVTQRIGTVPVFLRESSRKSNYSYLSLINHFYKLIFLGSSSLLRFIPIIGIFSVTVSFFLIVYVLYGKLNYGVSVDGWASVMISISFFSGIVLFALGVLAEYLAQTMGITMGKPHYVILSKPSR